MFQKYMGLLALAHPPQFTPSILGWRPFQGGDTLDTIVTRCNVTFYEQLKKNWLPEYIHQLIEGIRIIPHDLSTVDQVQGSEWDRIKILLADLDAINNSNNPVVSIRLRMAMSIPHPYFLTHVSQISDATPLTDELRGLPIYLSKPEILPNQAALEAFLSLFYSVSVAAVSGSSGPSFLVPPDTMFSINMKANRKAFLAYLKNLPQLVTKVRDVALMQGLSDAETKMLACRAAIQENALVYMAEHVRPSHRHRVVVDALRTPINHLAIQLPEHFTPDFEPVELVQLSLERPLRELTADQRHTLLDLGIKGQSFTAVYPDEAPIWDTVRDLHGAVRVSKFSAELPVWSKASTGESLGAHSIFTNDLSGMVRGKSHDLGFADVDWTL
jgi:hypothetical protein